MIRFITYQEYKSAIEKHPQWKSYEKRWAYHEATISMLKNQLISSPENVLEIGSFGVPLVKGSHQMDLPSDLWKIPEKEITFKWDVRKIPWPIQDKTYDFLVALRVWHHLAPFQEQAFLEAKRVAKNIIIECPEHEVVGVGILKEQFSFWNGAPPDQVVDFADWGKLYLFKEK